MPLIDLNGLGHFKAKENAMVADTYSASKTYAVGDYVYYNGTLYRCTTAITTAEAWTSGHWTAAKLGDDCSALKTAIDKIDNCFIISPNLFDPNAISVGLLRANNGNVDSSYTAYMASDFIPVNGGDKIRAQFTIGGVRQDSENNANFSFYSYAFYTDSKVYISGANGSTVLTAPTNAKYFRFTLKNDKYATLNDLAIIISASNTVIPFSAYDSIIQIKEEMVVDYLPPVQTRFNFPEKIYATTGLELNIYFSSIVEDWTEYLWDVTCAKGMQLERGFRFTPLDADAGEYTITIKAMSKNSRETVFQKTATIVTVASTAGSGESKSIIVLGDSTTNSGTVIVKLNANFADDPMSISTIGTRGTAPNNMEGRAGWALKDYFTKASTGTGADTVYNPFYNPSTQTFDADYYFTNSGIAKPDWFIVNMGINDMFDMKTDATAIAQATESVGYIEGIIESVQSASPNTLIGICVTIPPNESQDAFGKAYGVNRQTRSRYKRNNMILAEKIIENFSGMESDCVFLIPIYLSLDTVYNMGMESIPVNSRNATTYESPIGNGAVHPAEGGYWQIADVYTAFLKALA